MWDRDEMEHKRDKSREGVIFDSGLDASVRLERFESRFDIDGISLYDIGKNSLMSSSMYNQIKTIIHLEKQKN